jgi:enamine deaminase RidA (YjgF/YER057c/UK114 family)
MGTLRRAAALALAAALLTAQVIPVDKKKKKKSKKEKEEITQVLELPKDPPQAVVADVSRLVFHTSPLSARGLLSQQVRDALKALNSLVRGAQIIKVRAFVAGSGDVRRVQAIVSEEFTDRRLPIPAVTVIQVGALPMEGAQVIVQSIAVDRREANPNGLAWFSGQPGEAGDITERLKTRLPAVQAAPADVRAITCYFNSLDHVNKVREQMYTAFPKASGTYVQIRRDSPADRPHFVECEAVAVIPKPPLESPAFLGDEKTYSQVALIGPGRVAFTSAQMAFGKEDKDMQLTFDRLGKALESVGASWKMVAVTHSFPLTGTVAARAREHRKKFFDEGRAPASTLLVFEGLPSLDALFAVDAIAVVRR